MKLNLLPMIAAACLSAIAAQASAENRCYTYTDSEGYPVYSALRRVSPNGLWACGCDDYLMTGSLLINTSTPEKYVWTEDGLLFDVDDNGMAVGAWWQREGYAKYPHAAIFKDGKWTRLPLPDEIIGESEVMAISADSRILAGMGMCRNSAPDEPGKFFPMTWILNESTGRYELAKLYNDLDLPGTYGFRVSDMTPDGTKIIGAQWLNFSGTIPVMLDVETGKMTRWHELGEREMSQDINGKTYYYTVQTVDGIIEDEDDMGRNIFIGGFYYATDRYLFGNRNLILQVNEDGTGVVEHPSTVYDLQEGTFTDGSRNYFYLCGTSPAEAFTSNGKLAMDGVALPVNSYFTEIPVTVAGVYSFDNSGKIWTGSYLYDSPTGDSIESPVLMIFDEAYISGVSPLLATPAAPAKVTVSDGCIAVEGARRVAVYDPQGHLLSKSARTNVAPGVYIVVADGISSKIIVR